MCGTSATHEHGHDHNHAAPHTHEHGHEHNHAAAETHEHGVSRDAVEASYGVLGMDCSHCVASVTEELGRLGGVKNVDVELVVGGISRVTVASVESLDDEDVSAAIDEAGYELVDLPR
jgi:copper chaperone